MENKQEPSIAFSSRTTSRLIIGIFSVLSLALLIGCSTASRPAAASFRYKPPFIPITFSVDTNGHISISAGGSITTPLGTFSVGAEVGIPISKDSTRLSIVHIVSDASVEDVYDIGEHGPMNVCLDGRFSESVAEDNITITPLDGTSTISIIQAGNQCDTASPSLAANPETSAPASQEISTPASQALPSIAGVWTGTYTCAQGLTGLRLSINNSGGGALTATFDFYADPSNPGVPSGSFAMTGTYSATGLVLNQDHWINQPSGYDMVDLVAPPPTGNTIQGTIQASTPGCTDFSVTKVSTSQALPSIAGVWTGTYTCAQGLTGLRLSINNSGGGALTATFDFYADPSNPGVPSGSFAMTGTYSATGLVLNQDHWINQPSGYDMVDLVAPPPTGNTIQGTVQGVGGCTSFSVSR